MVTSGPPAIRSRLYLLGFLDEFGPIYALYTLWFADHGVEAAQLTIVFVVWAVAQSVLEVPTGALADRVDRRHLVAVAQALRGVGIGWWIVDPSLRGLLVGAALWALHSALASGAWEALIHDELAAVGGAGHYARVSARIDQCSNLGILSSAGLAALLAERGLGIQVAGWVTVVVHALAIAAVLALPDVSHVVADAAADDVDAPTSWGETLRAGLRVARTDRAVGRLLFLGAVVEGFFILDEYAALLVRDRGGGDALAAVMVMLVFFGLLVGGEVAARHPSMSPERVRLFLVGAMVLTIGGLAVDRPWGVAGLAAGYAALDVVWVLSDARLQERLSPTTRATVTSVRSLGGGALNAAAFALVGFLAQGNDAAPGLLVAATLLAVLGLGLTRLLPIGRTAQRA